MSSGSVNPVLAMQFAEYVITGWVLTGAVLGGYWLWIVRRTKRAERSRESQ
jgi:hypothetical protein